MVDAGGSGDYTTIQAAINAATNGQIIYIKNGTYAEHLTVNKSVTLQNYPAHAPLIDGSDSTAATLNVTTDATLRGLSIKGAHALGAGTHFNECNILASGNVTIENCTITDFSHCGIKTDHTLTIRNTTIHTGGDNHLDHCVYIAAGEVGEHIIDNCTLYGASGYGVHCYSYEYDVNVTACNIHDNATGGILLTGDRHVIDGNTISNNGGTNPNGGIVFYHQGQTDLTITDNTGSGNSAYDYQTDFSGGEGFTNLTFSNNTGTKNF